MDGRIGRVFLPVSLFDRRWFQFSIVSVTQSNVGFGGGSKTPAVARNGSVAKNGEEGLQDGSLGRSRSHIPDVAEMRRVFEQFDVNKDGFICSDELSGFMDRLGFKMSPEEVQNLVTTVDQNSDGHVDFEEFYDLYSSLTGADSKQSSDEKAQEKEHDENLRQAFRVFDKDGDGFITVVELQSVLLSLGMQEGKSLMKCQQMIKRVDADGNGKVDFQEFKMLMSSGSFQS